LNSISLNSSGSHSSTSHWCHNDGSGIGTSPPPPISLKTLPSLQKHSHESTSSQGSNVHVQRLSSIDTTTTDSLCASQLSHSKEDLQFSCGHEIPNSEYSNPLKQQSESFHARSHRIFHGKEAYEYMRDPSKPRTEPAPTSYYVNVSHGKQHSRSSLLPSGNYINRVIPADMKPSFEDYENTGFNSLKTPPFGVSDNLQLPPFIKVHPFFRPRMKFLLENCNTGMIA